MNNLVGLWGSERIFGPEIRGKLTVSKEGQVWSARIAEFEAECQPHDALHFSFGEEHGEFQGRLTADGSAIIGHWIQPKGIASGNSFATPTILRSTAKGGWSGEVVPLDDRLEMYLVIEQNAESDLVAFIRD